MGSLVNALFSSIYDVIYKKKIAFLIKQKSKCNETTLMLLYLLMLK